MFFKVFSVFPAVFKVVFQVFFPYHLLLNSHPENYEEKLLET